MRLFQERDLPMTVYGCGLAFERNPEASAAIAEAGHDICSHGWRWIKHYELGEAEEREHIRKAIHLDREDDRPSPRGLVLPLWTRRETRAASSSRKAGSRTTATTTATSCPSG